MLFGYIIPVGLLFISRVPEIVLPNIVLVWIFATVSVGLIIHFLSKAFPRSTQIPTGTNHSDLYGSRELPHINKAYKAMFGVSLLCHMLSIILSCFSMDAKFSFTHLPLPGVNLEQISDAHKALALAFLKREYVGAVLATVLFGLYSVYDLRSKGLVTTQDAFRAVAAFLLAQPLVGSGAGLVGLWWWREGRIWGKQAERYVKQEIEKKGLDGLTDR